MKTIGRQRRERPIISMNRIFGIGEIFILAFAAWLTAIGRIWCESE